MGKRDGDAGLLFRVDAGRITLAFTLMPTTPSVDLVEIHRKHESFPRWGFIIGESRSLMALHQVSDSYRLDGYCVIRREDIQSVKTRFKKRSLIRAALRIKSQEPVRVPELSLASMRAAAQSAQSKFGVLVIHRERVQPGEVEVGTLRLSAEHSYVLRWLSTLARWESDDRKFRYRDITLLEFGTEYDQTLFAVAAEHEG
jgi:hypothetical protein